MKSLGKSSVIFSIFLSTGALFAQTNHYVRPGGGSIPPYTNWADAATNIQDAIDAAAAGAFIWVTNGVYDTGGRKHTGEGLTNRVYINKAVTVCSVNGPEKTFIVGRWNNPGGDPYDGATYMGDAAVRCAWLSNGACLVGFTLTNGATRNADIFPPEPDKKGGGVYCAGADAVISNCVIIRNVGFEGGGGNNGRYYNCRILHNTARRVGYHTPRGGGIHSAVLFYCLVSGNVATNNAGGGLYNCKVYASTLANNTAHLGGGLALGEAHGCLIISNRVIQQGSNMGVGGGVYGEIGYQQYGGAIVSNCMLAANYGSWGSATYGGCTNYNCIIRGNHGDRSAVEGSGFDGFGIAGACYGCLICDNSGAYESSAAMRTCLYNCLVSGNSDRGINYSAAVRNCKVYNCTITANISTNNKPAVRLETTSAIGPLVVNSIVWGNTGGNIVMTTGTVTYTCTTPLPGMAGEGCFTNNPMFVAPAEGNWRLRPDSPCLNKGLHMSWMSNPTDAGSRDLDGGPRIRHGMVDMGAYELRVMRGTFFSAE